VLFMVESLLLTPVKLRNTTAVSGIDAIPSSDVTSFE
jgi:hypothetical protein